ncbi:MAG: succinylglutamate desuccinylase/aspartoacylase family protein, partial [Rhizobiaceae bacterium]
MERSIEHIPGDIDGVTYSFPVYRFDGSAGAPSAYIQAALHGDELPGVVAVDALMPLLRKADDEGRIRGRLTVVPWCNPIGRAQYLFGDRQGRFHVSTRTNFNRDFPLLASPDATLPAHDDLTVSVDARLKRRLLALSMGHDIVLDLHCDDESVPYLYVPAVLWPHMADCAAAMNMDAVVLWSGDCGAAFDQASIDPYLKAAPDVARFDRRIVTTVEYRGGADVNAALAQGDANGIYRVLVARGVIEDTNLPPLKPFAGLAAPIEHVEMVRSPCSGAILYHVKPGNRVEAGAALCTIVNAPGEPDGSVDIVAPQAGLVLTRRSCRFIEAGGDLV